MRHKRWNQAAKPAAKSAAKLANLEPVTALMADAEEVEELLKMPTGSRRRELQSVVSTDPDELVESIEPTASISRKGKSKLRKRRAANAKVKENPFRFGYANSMFQTSGRVCGESNWTRDADQGRVPDPKDGRNHFNNYQADIQRLKALGINAYRFSVEWSHIEPKEGEFDESVLDQYEAIVDECLQNGIEPMLTLYHFVEPGWFSDKGGFEGSDNGPYFSRYAAKVFERLSAKVQLWCVMNEPAVQAFSGYLYGQFPPHVHSPQRAVNFLKNILSAYVDTYQKLKLLDNGDKAQVGIVHNILKFRSRHDICLERFPCEYLTEITNNLLMNFFRTGRMQYHDVTQASLDHSDDRAPHAFDFFGLNFYARPIIGFNCHNFFGPTQFPGQKMGDMYLVIDPEGFSGVIDEAAALGKPVYITEMGMADKTDLLREELTKRYLRVIDEKISSGVDVRGTFLWTPWPNYEWNEQDQDFGYCSADGEPKSSALFYRRWMEAHDPLHMKTSAPDEAFFELDADDIVSEDTASTSCGCVLM